MKKTVNQSTLVIMVNALSVLFIAFAIVSFLNAISLSGQVDASNNDRFDLTFNANRFMDGSAYLTTEVRAFAVTGDMSHYDNYWNEINTLKNRDIGVETMKAIGITPEEQSKIDAMSALSNNLVPLESAAMDMTIAGEREAAIEAVYGAEYYKTIGQIQAIKDEFLVALDDRAEKHVNDLIRQVEWAQRLAVIFIVAVAVLQLLNVLVVMLKTIVPIKRIQKEMEEISKGNLSSEFSMKPDTSEIGRLTGAILETKSELHKYIRDISSKLEHLADGDLNLSVDLHYIGEFAPIKSALVKIIDSLNETVSQIYSSSKQVSAGSKQIADGSQVLAQGAVDQAASVERLSLSISEVAAEAAHGAEMAKEAAVLSDTIKTNAEKGSGQMNQMMQAVREINEASTSIGKVIKVIDDIAFQTNILALNAAVEAARAGQHGKGFAVVADEVRNLAAKSAEAAKDTGGLIANSAEKAQLGFDLATQTVASLQDIVRGIDQSAEIIRRIDGASSEQAESILHINSGIDQISQVVQQNSATAQQSAAASEQMSGQSVLLEQLVNHFNLKTRSGGLGDRSPTAMQAPVYPSESSTAFAMSADAKY